MGTVRYDQGVPQGLRAWIDANGAEKVHEVIRGTRDDDWRYMAYTRKGWCQNDDCVHSLIASTSAELKREIRTAAECHCAGCGG